MFELNLDYVEVTAAEAPQILYGDADGNGTVAVTDAILALRFSMGLISEEQLDTVAADVDGSGSVTVTDAVLILRRSMGLIDTFPIEG